MEAPDEVDAYRVEVLSQWNKESVEEKTSEMRLLHRVRTLLPKKTHFRSNELYIPIESVDELRNTIRALFRLNDAPVDDDEESDHRSDAINRTRRDEAFAKLRYLNELNDNRIRDLKQCNEKNKNRTGIKYHVGQVVQHREERWRGVVNGWSRAATPSQSSAQDQSSSLTTKHYESKDGPVPRYNILIDVNDSNFSPDSPSKTVSLETELSEVTDPYLQRVWNDSIKSDFAYFDSKSRSFVLSPAKRFEYPSDNTADEVTGIPPTTESLCQAITEGVDVIAKRLFSVVLESCMVAHPRSLPSTKKLWSVLKQLIEYETMLDEKNEKQGLTVPIRLAASRVRSLGVAFKDILSLANHRRFSSRHIEKRKFQVGDLVWHKKFHFRGLIVSWDPKPAINVTGWDGLADIPYASELPFYYVVPDQRDCIASFGAEKGTRYVCEANLDLCRRERVDVSLSLQEEWEHDGMEPYMRPPAEIRFAAGEEMGDDDLLEKTVYALEAEINQLQLLALSEAGEQFSVANLMKLLALVETPSDAAAIRGTLKDIRSAHEDLATRQYLDQGHSFFSAGQVDEARSIFAKLVESHPSYAEAWTRFGLLQLLEGDLADAEKPLLEALQLDPHNIHARNAYGLLQFKKSNFPGAVEHFRLSLDIDPWSAVSTRLSQAIDMIHMDTESPANPSTS